MTLPAPTINPLIPILVVIFATFIGAFGSLFLKKGSSSVQFKSIAKLFDKNLMLGIGLFVLSSIFYIGAMKYGELSLLYPITSLSYIWISFLSVRFLGERMNRYKWLGIAFIILGVVLINH